jgi:hypothetical protein
VLVSLFFLPFFTRLNVSSLGMSGSAPSAFLSYESNQPNKKSCSCGFGAVTDRTGFSLLPPNTSVCGKLFGYANNIMCDGL